MTHVVPVAGAPRVLERIAFSLGSRTAKPSPLLEALVALATNSDGPSTTCVVVPDSEGVAETVACLASLQSLASEWPQLEKAALRRSYRDGTLLRSIADGRIFIYRGDGPGGQSIKLQYSDSVGISTGGTFLKPRSILLQFEPTSRKRPVSTTGSAIHDGKLPFYDLVCGSSTYANSANICNRVVLLGYSTVFEEVLDHMGLTFAEGNGSAEVLKDFIWGALTEDGRTVATEPRGGLGEPFVAVTKDPLLLKALVRASEPSRRRLLVSNRIELALAHFDAIQSFSEKNCEPACNFAPCSGVIGAQF